MNNLERPERTERAERGERERNERPERVEKVERTEKIEKQPERWLDPSRYEIVPIKELNIDLIQPNPFTFRNPDQGGSKLSFIGKPGTGKSTLIKDFLYKKRGIFPVALAMSGSEDSNHFYKEFLPDTFIFNLYDEEQIKKVITRQKLSKQHLPNPWAVVIIDDCADEPKIYKRKVQQTLYKLGRHFKLLYLNVSQDPMDMPRTIRTSIDGTFIMREPLLSNRKRLYDNYASVIPDFKLFCELMDQITNDYTALYIHNTAGSNDWRECVFWYKAQKAPENFKFGCQEYWDFHNQRYDPNHIDNLVL